MIVDDLELTIKTCIEEGMTPLFVNATCGTTVLGAYDPVEGIADVCQKYDVWMHVDVSLDIKYVRSMLSAYFIADTMNWFRNSVSVENAFRKYNLTVLRLH